ncbi:MAG: TetR/AcrR family transcriptional regulator [Eubacteriales bacterium]
MDTFANISQDKQNKILNAGFICFGKNGYRKTSIADIAEVAGISKAAIFKYFGTKKELYFYLFDYAGREILSRMPDGTEDFFECIEIGALAKLEVMKKHSGMYDYLMSIVKETDEELVGELRGINTAAIQQGIYRLFAKADWSRFKPDVDKKMAMNIITWVSDGLLRSSPESMSLEELMAENRRYLQILKKALYKEEYL